MYTDDDKNNKFSFQKNNTRSNVENIYSDYSYDENFYKDYYDNNYNSKVNNKTTINKLDTEYTDDYSDMTDYNYNQNSLKRKKYVVIIMILFIVLVSLVVVLLKSINITKPPVGNNSNYVHLKEKQINLKIGQSEKLELILSDIESNYEIHWFSNNDNVAIVDESGNVKAINEGEAIILVAYYLKDKIYDAECRVYVSK